MMQWRLKTLIAQYEENNPGEALSYRRMEAEIGISKTIITKIATNKADRADRKTMNALLDYFSAKLGRKLVTSDLLEYTTNTPTTP